jgi:hypothetical protein
LPPFATTAHAVAEGTDVSIILNVNNRFYGLASFRADSRRHKLGREWNGSGSQSGGLKIVDGSGSVLYSTGLITIGSNHFTFDNISSTTGIGILVQNPWLVAIDNIQFISHAPGPVVGAGIAAGPASSGQ